MKSNLLSLILAITLAGCGDDTAATVTTEGASSSGDPNLTDGVSQTSNTPTTTIQTSSSSDTTSTSTESTTGGTLTSTTLEPTTSSSTTTDASTTTDETTSGVETCEGSCTDGVVTRQQIAMDMGMTCEELFSPMFCEAPNNHINKAEAIKVVSDFLEQTNKLNGCEDFVPLEHPDVDMDDWYFQHVQNLHCVGILNEMANEDLCPSFLACQGWWMDLWNKAQMVP